MTCHETISELLIHAIQAGQPVRLRVTGTSMQPLLRPGDFITVAPVENAALHPGEILLLRREHDFVTHRLLFCLPQGLFTKGDACLRPDPLFDRAQVLGRAVSRDRGGETAALETLPWAQLAWHRAVSLPWLIKAGLKPW
ncbi:MAG TPA: S26 family signal peptidase [Anaerolineaceae bacterium]|nr:S26 family signal peptidase [Anaerolineaceae bacterium]HPN53448.1 S26 family signal peptidase [Anaerolineaceae bacterium]